MGRHSQFTPDRRLGDGVELDAETEERGGIFSIN